MSRYYAIPAVASFALMKAIDAVLPAQTAEGRYFAGGVAELRKKRGPFFPDRDVRSLAERGNGLLEKAYVFPDIDTIKMLFMVPTPVMAPGMVMTSGLDRIRRRFGTADSQFLISFRGLDLRTLMTALRQAEKTGHPMALLGATWGFDYFFDSCRNEGVKFHLPEGSRIVDSRGYVGRYTKCSGEEFFGKCGEILGIGRDFCINALWCAKAARFISTMCSEIPCPVQRGKDARRFLPGAEQ